MLLWVLAAPAWAEPPELVSPEVENAVQIGLSMLGVDAVDLAWPKDRVNGEGVLRDTLAMPVVSTLLQQPLAIPDDAQRVAGAVVMASADPVALVQVGAAELGLTPTPLTTPPKRSAHDTFPSRRDRRQLSDELLDIITWADTQLDAVEQQVRRGTPAGTRKVALEYVSGWTDTSDDLSGGVVGRLATLQALQRGAALDSSAQLGAAIGLAEVAVELETRLAALPDSAWPTHPVQLAEGRVLIGSTGSDAIVAGSEAPRLIVDPGGDDIFTYSDASPARLLVDLGGHDSHPAAAGRAVAGVTVAIDTNGNDHWRGGRVGPAGAAYGVAVVVDRAGDDHYDGELLAQGAAVFGVGVLSDIDGDDTYRVGTLGQGAALTGGYGVLHDHGGDDVYLAGGRFSDTPTRAGQDYLTLSQGFSHGERNWAGGGLGLLVDTSGNDNYIADIYGQGASYWLGRGYLVDAAGNDTYQASQYAQGCAVHSSVAGLFDLGGDDTYTMDRLGQGTSHDRSAGWFVDRAGNDLYSARAAAQGGCLRNSVCIFVDEAGNDHYFAPGVPDSSYRGNPAEKGRGGGNYFWDLGLVALNLDLAGEDRRDAIGPKEGGIYRPWVYGAAIDFGPGLRLPSRLAAVPAPEPLPHSRQDPLLPAEDLFTTEGRAEWRASFPAEAVDQISGLDALAQEPEQAHEALQSAIETHGSALFIDLLPGLKDEGFMTPQQLGTIFRLVAERAPHSHESLLAAIDAELAATPRGRLHGVALGWRASLGAGPDKSPDLLAALAGDDEPATREAVAQYLGRVGTDPGRLLHKLVADPHPIVRARAVAALARVGAPPRAFVRALDDENMLVRHNAAEALLSHINPNRARAVVRERWDQGDFARPVIRLLHLQVLGRLGDDEVLLQALESPRSWAAWHARQILNGRAHRWRHVTGNSPQNSTP